MGYQVGDLPSKGFKFLLQAHGASAKSQVPFTIRHWPSWHLLTLDKLTSSMVIPLIHRLVSTILCLPNLLKSNVINFVPKKLRPYLVMFVMLNTPQSFHLQNHHDYSVAHILLSPGHMGFTHQLPDKHTFDTFQAEYQKPTNHLGK